MIINDPIVSNNNISFGLSAVNTALIAWYIFKKTDVVGITGSDPTTITDYLDKYFPLEVLASTTTEFRVTDFPYVSGELTLFLQDSDGWTRKDFVLVNTKRTTGINFPVQIQTAAIKQPTPLMSANDIKGAPKYYSTFQDFLYMPREHMVPNITAYVFDSETNTIKQFVLDRNGQDIGNGTFGQIGESDIPNLPFPLLKIDITNSRSYQRFWTKIAESTPVNPTTGTIRYYAPDYEDGVPPLYDNLLATGTPGVTYPVGLSVPSDSAYDKQREFLGVWAWNAVTAQFENSNAGTTTYFATRQVTKTQKPGDKWFIESVDGVSFSRWRRIGQFDAGSVQQNRYIRRVTDIADPYGDLTGGDPKYAPTPFTFLNGLRNRFGQYEEDFNQGGTPVTLQYEDVPPDKRLNKASLVAAEASMYDDFIADGVSAIDVDGLWEVLCIKDKYNRLESDFSPARYIPRNGDLVRYSANDTPDINDLTQVDWTSNGWEEEFNPDIHRYKAERASTEDNFQIVLISAEIGTYTSRVYKAYPLRYFDVLTSSTTQNNYSPVGLGAGINSLDDVDSTFTWVNESAQTVNAPNKGAWVDGPFQPPVGWTLWVSEAVFYFGGDTLKTPWSPPTLFDSEAQIIDLIEGQQDFHSTPSVDNNGNTTVSYDPGTIDLTATLYLYTQRETDNGQKYVINDDANEVIKYKWERIFNNGSADTTIIFDNTSTADGSELISDEDLVGGSYTYSPGTDTFRIESSGRVCRIYPAGLDKRAIYRVTQERTTEGGSTSYTEETAGLLDVADGLPSKIVVATSDRPYFVLLGDATTSGGLWQADDYTNPKNGTDYPEIILRAFIQNVDQGAWYRWSSGEDFDTVRLDDLGGGVTKERSTSATYWTQISTSDAVPVAANSSPWNDGTINKQVIYKYQSGAYYDLVRLERIQEGADIKDLDLRANSQIISYNGGETDYDPTGQIIEFRAVNQNLSAGGINWEILDKAGLDISSQVILYDQMSGGSPISDGATLAYLRTSDYPAATAWRYNNLFNNLPVTVKITHDDDADQIDFVTFRKVSSGSDGPAGTDAVVGFLDNEAENQTCNESGIPINASQVSSNGSLAIKTNIVVYSGATDITSQYQIGGANPFSNITAVDETGATLTKGTGTSNYDYQLSNSNRTLTVTRLPENKQKLVISIPIYRSSDTTLLVTRKLTISKSLAGFTPLRMVLGNEFIMAKRTPDGAVIDTSSVSLTGFGLIGTLKIQGFIGGTEQTLSLTGSVNDSIVGYQGNLIDSFDTTWTNPGVFGEASARYIRYMANGNDFYLVLGASGTLYVISSLTNSGVDFDFQLAFQAAGQITSRKFSIRWLEQPADQYQVVVFCSNPTFSATELTSASRLISARVITNAGVETASIPSGWSMEFSAGTVQSAQAGYTATIKITRGQVNISKQITVKLKNGTGSVVSVGTITIYDLKDAPSFEELFYATDSSVFPAKPSGSYASFPDSANNQWGKTQDVNLTYLYVSRKSQYTTEWGWPIQVKGERGTQGLFAVTVYVYKVSAEKPAISGGTIPTNPSDYTTFGAPSGWSKTPTNQGGDRLWSASRSLEKSGNTWSFSGDWTVFLLGSREPDAEVYVYRGATTATPSWYQSYDNPETQYPQSSGSAWKNSISEVTPTNYIFRARGKYSDGTLRKKIISGGHPVLELNAVSAQLVSGSTYLFLDSVENIITTGVTNDAYIFANNLYIKQASGNWLLDNSKLHWWDIPELIYQQISGPAGPKGDKPLHQWNGTQLRFENPDGTWGAYTNLVGPGGPVFIASYYKATSEVIGDDRYIYIDRGTDTTGYIFVEGWLDNEAVNYQITLELRRSSITPTGPSSGNLIRANTISSGTNSYSEGQKGITAHLATSDRYIIFSIKSNSGSWGTNFFLKVTKVTSAGTVGDGVQLNTN